MHFRERIGFFLPRLERSPHTSFFLSLFEVELCFKSPEIIARAEREFFEKKEIPLKTLFEASDYKKTSKKK